MKLPDLIVLIENDGWCRTGRRGSHRQYTHPRKPGVLTIRRRPADELSARAVQCVAAQAGVTP